MSLATLQNETPDRSTIEIIEERLKGMTFRSEASDDAPLQLFAPRIKASKGMYAVIVSTSGGKTLNEPPHYTFDEFMDHNSQEAVQPNSWKQFIELKESMVELLGNDKVFRMSRLDENYNTTYYVAGNDNMGNIVGFFVGATET